MQVSILLILLGVLACGCRQSSPPQAPGEKEGVETEGVAAVGSAGEEREERAESSCRAATYASNEGLSRQEAAAFFERVANETAEEMEGHPSLRFSHAKDATLNPLGVPRYQECEN